MRKEAVKDERPFPLARSVPERFRVFPGGPFATRQLLAQFEQYPMADNSKSAVR